MFKRALFLGLLVVLMLPGASLAQSTAERMAAARKHFEDRAYDLAISEYESIIADDPSNYLAMRWLIRIYENLGELDGVKADYERRIRENPADKVAHYCLGVTLSEMGDHRSAIEELTRATGLDPKFAAAYTQLARSLSVFSDYESSLRHLERALEIEPDNADHHI